MSQLPTEIKAETLDYLNVRNLLACGQLNHAYQDVTRRCLLNRFRAEPQRLSMIEKGGQLFGVAVTEVEPGYVRVVFGRQEMRAHIHGVLDDWKLDGVGATLPGRKD
jgi:hypothetical protein